MAKGQGKVASNKSAIVARLPKACCGETERSSSSKMNVGAKRTVLPRCGDTDVYKMTDRKNRRAQQTVPVALQWLQASVHGRVGNRLPKTVGFADALGLRFLGCVFEQEKASALSKSSDTQA